MNVAEQEKNDQEVEAEETSVEEVAVTEEENITEAPAEEQAAEETSVEEIAVTEEENITEAPAEEQAAEETSASDTKEEASEDDTPETKDSSATEEEESEAAETTPVVPDAAADVNTKKSDHKWYIIHAYSGFEKKVAAAIEEQAQKKGMNDLFEQIVVPTESIVEVKKGKKVNTERKFFPGYVLAKMIMSDETWHLVKNTPKVTGFIGGDKNSPIPISETEAEKIFSQMQEGKDSPRHKVIFQVGDAVKVIDGPFDSFMGSIEEVDEDREKLHVSVSIFGRPTPLELEYTQVEKA